MTGNVYKAQIHRDNIVRLVKGGIDMIQNKKGLSDIVTTALIILLVAVAVAAIWAFVSPALRGTGIQFTKTQVCVSNLIEPITCKTTAPAGTDGAGNFPISVQIRRTLTDGVAVPTEFETVAGTTGFIPAPERVKTTDITTPAIPKNQGELVTIVPGASLTGISVGKSPQVQVTTTYRLPDNTIVKCPSLPITCNL